MSDTNSTMIYTVKLSPCKDCNEYCRKVEDSDGEVWCQYCDRCVKMTTVNQIVFSVPMKIVKISKKK